ncbi:endonuclease/exonuclease/phosphatase family protein [Roseococcus suduntuyensis]|uniref:Endonuclease/exonuclease/phosphatase family metal-dependent hydrolase n=1 Tax=Roseococcus suduntuyensis TaxID=455361 RepID=A0A840AGP7_9PROT|nr:endonuclease/exonuclease/phosphatase family protein [Roseococcus suduntuyensis]MBB3900062.1 endonuclease/exonuclease/phosphatase family metal-dependent hydrolase [Roseococcus suduntuyensis]
MRLLILLLLLVAGPLQAAELRLTSWNIAWLSLRPAGDPMIPAEINRRGPADVARLQAYAQRLEADIVALQEVDGPEAAARVFSPRDHAFFFPDEEDVQRTGFAVRRHLRVTQNPDLVALDVAPQARFSHRRGTDITVEWAGGRLRLLSIHLAAGCQSGPLEAERSRQCANLATQSSVLAGWVAAREREGIPYAILGDFNRRMDHPRDEMSATLEQAGRLLRANEGTSDPCWAGPRGGRPFISHILLGGPARGWMVPGSLRVMVYAERDRAMRDLISDHCPLSIRLRAR